jgi:hypothetical protein
MCISCLLTNILYSGHFFAYIYIYIYTHTTKLRFLNTYLVLSKSVKSCLRLNMPMDKLQDLCYFYERCVKKVKNCSVLSNPGIFILRFSSVKFVLPLISAQMSPGCYVNRDA